MQSAEPTTIFFDGAFYPQDRAMFGIVSTPDDTYQHDFGPGYDNNEAEWRAAMAAIDHAIGAGIRSLILVGDSEMIVEQAKGERGCLSAAHQPHLKRLRSVEHLFDSIAWRHVPRSANLAGRELSRRQRRGDLRA